MVSPPPRPQGSPARTAGSLLGSPPRSVWRADARHVLCVNTISPEEAEALAALREDSDSDFDAGSPAFPMSGACGTCDGAVMTPEEIAREQQNLLARMEFVSREMEALCGVPRLKRTEPQQRQRPREERDLLAEAEARRLRAADQWRRICILEHDNAALRDQLLGEGFDVGLSPPPLLPGGPAASPRRIERHISRLWEENSSFHKQLWDARQRAAAEAERAAAEEAERAAAEAERAAMPPTPEPPPPEDVGAAAAAPGAAAAAPGPTDEEPKPDPAPDAPGDGTQTQPATKPPPPTTPPPNTQDTTI
eukprot:TRINITY_DN40500_c0_g1_i1.p1 TRINITY_DN40500_c0_g1~~TRINITY_DN40500_c0_g1_i1.p1  ORF type:complete len:359 (+),score=86.06 TRINITY_DN40500_c0_g1_i1:159-1079(+)